MMHSMSPQPRFRRRVQTINNSPSLTEQAHKDDCNINKILKKFQQTGVITHNNKHEGTYNDYTNAPGYQDAQNIIANANSLFASLPSGIRADMDNNPSKFVDFMQNPENRDAIIEYGLSTAHLPADPDAKPIVYETAPPTKKPATATTVSPEPPVTPTDS